MSRKYVILVKSDYSSLNLAGQIAWRNWLKRQYKASELVVRRALKAWRAWTRKATTFVWSTWTCDRPVPDCVHNLITTAKNWLQAKWREWQWHNVTEYRLGVFHVG